MAWCLKAGDHVRVTVRNGLSGYRPGDRGEVLGGPYTKDDILEGPSTDSGIQQCYIVTMDSGSASRLALFIVEEIELEV